VHAERKAGLLDRVEERVPVISAEGGQAQLDQALEGAVSLVDGEVVVGPDAQQGQVLVLPWKNRPPILDLLDRLLY
jgi:hypothetical protein